MNDELKEWTRLWQAWDGGASEWAKKAQVAHRHEAAIRVAYWAALVVGVLAVSLAVYRHGLQRWPHVAFGVCALVFGVGVMLRSGAQVRHDRRQLTGTPAGLVADLVRVHERELAGWTAGWAKLSSAALALAGAAFAFLHLWQAAQHQASLLAPSVIVGVYAAALGVIARVGARRARKLVRELAELRRIQSELTQ